MFRSTGYNLHHFVRVSSPGHIGIGSVGIFGSGVETSDYESRFAPVGAHQEPSAVPGVLKTADGRRLGSEEFHGQATVLHVDPTHTSRGRAQEDAFVSAALDRKDTNRHKCYFA